MQIVDLVKIVYWSFLCDHLFETKIYIETSLTWASLLKILLSESKLKDLKWLFTKHANLR